MSPEDTTSDIAGEAEDTRERIAATIDALQDRLSPRRIVSDAVDSVQSQGADLLDDGLRFVKAHPAIIAGAGLAVGVVLLGGSRLRKARVDMGEGYESYSDYDDDYASNENAAGSRGTERFALMRGRAEGGVHESPLVAIFVGLAGGALLGALFPETESERRLLARANGRFGNVARAVARTTRSEFADDGAAVGGPAHGASTADHSFSSVPGLQGGRPS